MEPVGRAARRARHSCSCSSSRRRSTSRSGARGPRCSLRGVSSSCTRQSRTTLARASRRCGCTPEHYPAAPGLARQHRALAPWHQPHAQLTSRTCAPACCRGACALPAGAGDVQGARGLGRERGRRRGELRRRQEGAGGARVAPIRPQHAAAPQDGEPRGIRRRAGAAPQAAVAGAPSPPPRPPSPPSHPPHPPPLSLGRCDAAW